MTAGPTPVTQRPSVRNTLVDHRDRIRGNETPSPGAWVYVLPVAPAATPPDQVPSDALAPSFQNSWGNTAAGQACSFRIHPLTKVQIRGAIEGGAVPSVVFTLPAGFRPSKPTPIVFPSQDANEVYTGLIDTTGEVSVTALVAGAGGIGILYGVDNEGPWLDVGLLGVIPGTRAASRFHTASSTDAPTSEVHVFEAKGIIDTGEPTAVYGEAQSSSDSFVNGAQFFATSDAATRECQGVYADAFSDLGDCDAMGVEGDATTNGAGFAYGLFAFAEVRGGTGFGHGSYGGSAYGVSATAEQPGIAAIPSGQEIVGGDFFGWGDATTIGVRARATAYDDDGTDDIIAGDFYAQNDQASVRDMWGIRVRIQSLGGGGTYKTIQALDHLGAPIFEVRDDGSIHGLASVGAITWDL